MTYRTVFTKIQQVKINYWKSSRQLQNMKVKMRGQNDDLSLFFLLRNMQALGTF